MLTDEMIWCLVFASKYSGHVGDMGGGYKYNSLDKVLKMIETDYLN